MDASFITADFTSFEDFSSRMVLLPRHDDECTGAKVGSHEGPLEECSTGGGEIATDAEASLPAQTIEADIAESEQADAESNDPERPPSSNPEGVSGAADPAVAPARRPCSICRQDLPKTEYSKNQWAKKEASSKCKACVAGVGTVPAPNDAEAPPEVKIEPAVNGDAGVEGEAKTPEIEDSTRGHAVEDVQQHNSSSGEKLKAVQVPMGHVLVKITRTNGDDSDLPKDLDSIDFAALLSFFRGASFPLSLVFAPPNESPSSLNSRSNRGSFFADDDESKDGTSSSESLQVEEESDSDESSTVTNETPQQPTALVSREDAAKYAKQAASAAADLRGRLGRWGYQAVTQASIRAADAATHVKELRDERQRKMKDEQQSRDSKDASGGNEVQSEVANPKPETSEEGKQQSQPTDATITEDGTVSPPPKSVDPMEPCFMFLQTASGFEQLPAEKDETETCTVTSSSVISVRLSQEKACPLGKQAYEFQWYRSRNANGFSTCSDDETASNQSGWTLLAGACYAAYQPNITDVGHRLQCIIKHDNEQQTCELPCLVSLEQSLLDAAKVSLLNGQKSVSFGNLRGVDDLCIYRLTVEVNSDSDFISKSAIYIEKVAGGSEEESCDSTEPIPHFRAVADPAKPKLFDLICSTKGRLRLDTANRKTRESLLLALGIANFKCSHLSSLTTETALFSTYDTEDIRHTPNDNILEAKLAEMSRILQSKDLTIAELQRKLVTSDASKRQVEEELESCLESQRLLQEALDKSETKVREMNRAQLDAEAVQERTVKALNNEKAVLQAAIEARDGKIEGLASKISTLEERTSAQKEQLSEVESLKSNLVRSQEKCSSAERVIAKMKETECELQEDLRNARGIVLDLNNKFLAAKETANKCESDCRKLKMERCTLRNRAEGLTKELSRMSKNKSEALEIERLKNDITASEQRFNELNRENADLQREVEVAKAEKRDAVSKLEATQAAHQQSVSYQLAGKNDITASEQRINELESVISSMTEYLNAKEMQLDTLKEVNSALASEISQLQSSK